MTPAISSFTAPVAPPSATPQAAPPQAAPAQANAFAQMLSHRQAMAREASEPAVAPAPANQPATPEPAAKRAAVAPQATERSAAQAVKADKADKADKTKAPRAAAPAPEEVAAPGDKTDVSDVADAGPGDPALAEWLAALNLPAAPAQAPQVAATPATVASPAEQPATGKPGNEAQQGAHVAKGGGRGLIDTSVGNGPRADAAPASADRLEASRDARDARAARDKPAALAAEPQANVSAWQAAVERTSAPAETPQRLDTPAVGALGAAAHAAPAVRTSEPAAPLVVSMPTPATAPEFAHSLGVQVSVFARDGIQQAELHLNPAEMGPISVQIALDGSQAQVNFGADSAATRQVIESGLPELAAALRDAGFTLSGGGVHSQARGRGEGGDAGDGAQARRQGQPAATEVTARRVTARVSAGGVDLYA